MPDTAARGVVRIPAGEPVVTGYAQTVGEGIDQRLKLSFVEVDGRLSGATRDRQEILYVLSGSGTLRLGGEEHELEPDAGVLILPREEYELEGDLRLVSVVAPAEEEIERERVVSRFADRKEERADAKRTFRVLHQGELTQFIGIVEPCRAPDHSHPYDEVGYIVEGRGIAHIAGEQVPLQAGSCFYLPPGCVHCIENTGPGVMRIMGVFHPAGSPKQRSYGAASE
jgi:mannose-6-phosphate isomerase-like protein (cupin superfamily)